MKVLHMIDALGLGGGAEHALAVMLPELRHAGLESVVVCLVAREQGIEHELRAKGFSVVVIESRHFLGQVRAVRRFIASERPDVVHATLHRSCLVSRFACLGTSVALVNSIVNTPYDPVRAASLRAPSWKLEVLRLIDRLTIKMRADRVHALTQAVRHEAEARLGVRAARITVLPRGRSSAALGERTPLRRAAARRSLGLSDDAFVVLTVGRQDSQKAHDALVRAFAELKLNEPKAVLLIAGRPGNATEVLEQVVAEVRLGSAIRVLGHRDDVADLLVAADLFAFPSLYEGLGSAMIEAMALQTPIVASDAPAIAEVLEGGRFGRLVPRGDVSALASALNELACSPGDRSQYAEAARRGFDDRYELSTVVDGTIQMYEQTVNDRTGAGR